MPAPTREELILNLKSNPKTKGMTDAQIAAKADEILPKLVEKYGGEATVKETVKVAPKAPPKSATPAPKAPAPKPAPVAPKVVEKETVRVTTAPIGPARPDMSRDYSDTMPPMARSRATEVMPKPEMELVGIKQGGEGVYRARDMLAPEPSPMLDKPAIPSYMTRYGGMGDIRASEDEAAGMRAAVKARFPSQAAKIDALDAADLADAYKRLTAE